MPLPAFSNLSLRSQMAVVFGTLVVGLSVLLSVAFGELLKLRIQRDAGVSLQLVATNAGRLLADGLRTRQREVEVLAASEVIWTQGLDTPEVQHVLQRSQAMHPHSAWIGVADAQGIVQAATGGLLVGQSVAERPWFQAGLQAAYVGDLHAAKLLEKLLPPTASGEPYRFVDFAAPIRLGPTTVGVLGVHGSWEWTREVMEGMLPARSDDTALDLFVFDQRGQMIFSRAQKAPDAAAGNPQTLPWEADGSRTGASVLRWGDDHRYLTAASSLGSDSVAANLGWTVVARVPVEVAFAEADGAVLRAVGLGLLAGVLASALGWLAARRLSHDLDALATAAARVEADQAGADIPVTEGSLEVRKLSSALNRMTQHLVRARGALEEKVRLRTLELEAANRALDLQARTDALTGLLNRRGLEGQMAFNVALARRSSRPLSLIAVDVDHFKQVNDSFGHEAGDEVLRRLARLLEDRLRASDVVARLGGEEFVAVLPDTDLAGAQAIAQALVDACAARADAVVGRITVSAGVSTLTGPTDTATAMLRRADMALYEAKGQGRNRVCVQE